MGEFFTPPAPKAEHRCDLPEWPTENYWRCDCGKAYRKEPLGYRDRGVDPREPDWRWVRAPEFDKYRGKRSRD